jgi:hypothetical protein
MSKAPLQRIGLTALPGWTRMETERVIRTATQPMTPESIADKIVREHRSQNLPRTRVLNTVRRALRELEQRLVVRVTGELAVQRQGRRPRLYEWCGESSGASPPGP